MFSMRFDAWLDIYYGLPHLFIDAGRIVDSLTNNPNAVMKCLFIVNTGCISNGF
jgi:hypothetical protein